MPHVICGIPETLYALFTTAGGISGSGVRFVVLDEVDDLIARNLQDVAFDIVKLLPPPGVHGSSIINRQSVMYARTLPCSVIELLSTGMRLSQPVLVLLLRGNNTRQPKPNHNQGLRGLMAFRTVFFVLGLALVSRFLDWVLPPAVSEG